MAYYIIHVRTREEAKFLYLTQSSIRDKGINIFYPRKRLKQYKKGKPIEAEVPLFPGYVFVYSEDKLKLPIYYDLKKIPGFLFLFHNKNDLKEIQGKDLQLLNHLLTYGEVLEPSLITFDKDQRIQVIQGVLKGLEGHIISIDRRKTKAKVLLQLDQKAFYTTLGYQEMKEALPADV